MRVAEARHIVHRGCRHRPHAGHGGQMPGRLIGCDDLLQLLVQQLELAIDGTEEVA
jgi:hypothetical protein